MSLAKKIGCGMIIAFIAIQFIRPVRNTSERAMPGDITSYVGVPIKIQTLLKISCYDCHSNNTNYPWYSNIQPAASILAHHIKNGKAKLNFNEFGSYTARRQISKLKSVASQIQDGDMPLMSYTIIHRNASLSQTDKDLIITWAAIKADSLSIIKNNSSK